VASSSLEDAWYRADLLEKVVLEEMKTLNPPLDALEACLISVCGNGVDPYLDDEIGIYAEVFNLAQPYLPRHQPREVLNVDVCPSNEDKKGAPEMEIKPLPSHLRYEFLGSNHTFPVIVSAKFKLRNRCVCFKSIEAPMAIALMISKGLAPYFVCIAF